ncbi:MAG: hypothetical protein JSW26_01305 [Desulfobacterales bacterium]|nr:MAG: hypothetical protein JSW26_01305 [Desulfobacterales bacterium]
MTDHWKQVAWNGIRFKAPPEWEIGQIGIRHLILEDESGPVMEVKWGPVKGSFSHRAHLKRLSASQSRINKGSIAEWFLPPPWEKALADYKTSGFVWQSKNTSGRGAILFCPVCRNATLIQFFGDSWLEREKVLLAVLKSLRDHLSANVVLWTVFDIRLKLPAALRLTRYRFETGKYELLFTDGRQNLRFYRWAPAAAILGGRDLIWFCGTIPEFAAGQPEVTTIDGCAAIEGCFSPAGDWRRAISRLKAKPSFFWFRLWHLEDKNRILGVRAESKRALDFHLLGQICSDYESL